MINKDGKNDDCFADVGIYNFSSVIFESHRASLTHQMFSNDVKCRTTTMYIGNIKIS